MCDVCHLRKVFNFCKYNHCNAQVVILRILARYDYSEKKLSYILWEGLNREKAL
jgi:hypothetical protein